MIEIILSILKNKTVAGVIVFLLIVASLGGAFAYLTHRARQAEKQAEAQREENKRLEQQNEGLKIIVGSTKSAAEVEKLKEQSNAQSQNSNLSNSNFTNSVRRDSGTFSGNANESKQRFCRNFP